MFHLRPYQPADLEGLVALINTADAVDQAGMRTSADVLRHELGDGSDEPVFLAEEEGRLVGYIQLALDRAPGTRHYYGYGTVLPGCRRGGIGTALFQHALGHLRQVGAECADRILFDQFARLWIPGVEPLVQKLGFTPGKSLHSLRRPHLAELAAPTLPPGYYLRPVTAADSACCAAVYTSAYQWRGDGTVRTPEEMAATITAPGFQADLFPVTVNPVGQVAGYAYATLNRGADGCLQAGRIYTIAVDMAEQGCGVGRALLAASLLALSAAGAPEVTLSVEADNPTPALGMYRRAGFNEWRRAVLYHSPPL